MQKSQQFILLVQMSLTIYYAAKASEKGLSPLHQAAYAREHLAEAFNVADHIPEDVPVQDAADAFLRFVIRRDDYEPEECPDWLVKQFPDIPLGK